MINQSSLDAVKNASFGPHFCKPLYDSYCFSRIPATIFDLLTKRGGERLPLNTTGDERYECVILLFIDCFGWRFFEKYASQFPFLKRFIDEGIVSKITSQFPSTTAGHVTTMNTGLSVGQSGVYEWFYYEPKLDRIITPLMFSNGGDKRADTLKETGIDPKTIYPRRSFYKELKEAGITTYSLQPKEIADSVYSQVMFEEALKHPYSSLERAFTSLKPTTPSYISLYFPDIDSMGHHEGIDSREFEEAIHYCFTTLETLFVQTTFPKKTACIITADHGMTKVDPKTTFYLNLEFPTIVDYLKRNQAGKVIAPAGSCRDFFLHCKEEKLSELKEILTHLLHNRAVLYTTEELIKLGFFEKVSQDFLDRVGNLVILPYGNHSVFWFEKNRYDQHFFGAHGGLSREEMETIFLFRALT